MNWWMQSESTQGDRGTILKSEFVRPLIYTTRSVVPELNSGN